MTGNTAEMAKANSCILESSTREQTNPLSTEKLMREELSSAPPLLQIEQRTFLLNGEIKTWEGPQQSIVSPLSCSALEETGGVIGSYPMLTAAEGMEAVTAARDAYHRGLGDWPSASSEERITAVESFLSKMIEHREEISSAIMWEIGKTEADAFKEFDRTVQYIRETILELRRINSKGVEAKSYGDTIAELSRAPLGVVLCMGPFNYPLNETLTTMIPAVLAGNTVVMKPPKIGVLLFEPMLKAFQECFPKGVVNVIYGDGREIITPIMESGYVDALAFIGSSKVASSLVKLHPAPSRLHLILGLGAKNPAIVLPDADIDLAVKECVAGSLSFNGQRCTALKKLYVHEDIAEEFCAKMKGAVENLKLGQPWEKGVSITPLAEPGKVQWMEEYVDDAISKGAHIINDGGGSSRGQLYTPALLYPVDSSMKIFHEEQFGPVVPIAPFSELNDVVNDIANSSLGQQASIFTKDVDVADKLGKTISRIIGGRANLNTQCQRGPDQLPFGGSKDSALGVLSIRDALLIFSNPTVMAWKA